MKFCEGVLLAGCTLFGWGVGGVGEGVWGAGGLLMMGSTFSTLRVSKLPGVCAVSVCLDLSMGRS